MVVLDEYSRFPLVETISSTSAQIVTRNLEIMFSIFGLPDEVRSDNGPPFNSYDFREFAKYLGFQHRLITPEWPQANGMAESFMKNLVRVIRSALIDKVSWKVRLIQFLRNYRSTQHSTLESHRLNCFSEMQRQQGYLSLKVILDQMNLMKLLLRQTTRER